VVVIRFFQCPRSRVDNVLLFSADHDGYRSGHPTDADQTRACADCTTRVRLQAAVI
jgi:hypothetical protein